MTTHTVVTKVIGYTPAIPRVWRAAAAKVFQFLVPVRLVYFFPPLAGWLNGVCLPESKYRKEFYFSPERQNRCVAASVARWHCTALLLWGEWVWIDATTDALQLLVRWKVEKLVKWFRCSLLSVSWKWCQFGKESSNGYSEKSRFSTFWSVWKALIWSYKSALARTKQYASVVLLSIRTTWVLVCWVHLRLQQFHCMVWRSRYKTV